MLFYLAAAVAFVLAQLAWFLLGKVICRVRRLSLYPYLYLLLMHITYAMFRKRTQRLTVPSSRLCSRLYRSSSSSLDGGVSQKVSISRPYIFYPSIQLIVMVIDFCILIPRCLGRWVLLDFLPFFLLPLPCPFLFLLSSLHDHFLPPSSHIHPSTTAHHLTRKAKYIHLSGSVVAHDNDLSIPPPSFLSNTRARPDSLTLFIVSPPLLFVVVLHTLANRLTLLFHAPSSIDDAGSYFLSFSPSR